MTEEIAAPKLIQGKAIGSSEEWRVALALNKYKIEYLYQVPVRGGKRVRGGQVIDFLVYNPFPTPLQVFGKYWHEGQMGTEDHLKLAVLQQIYTQIPIILWGRELETQDEADDSVRRKVL